MKLQGSVEPESVKVSVASVVSHSLQPHGLLLPPRLLCPWDSPGKNTGVGSHALLQGIFPNQGWNPGSPTLQADSLPSEPPDLAWGTPEREITLLGESPTAGNLRLLLGSPILRGPRDPHYDSVMGFLCELAVCCPGGTGLSRVGQDTRATDTGTASLSVFLCRPCLCHFVWRGLLVLGD